MINMARYTTVKQHLSLDEMMKQLRHAKDADKRMRWQIIYTVSADPRDGKVIARQLGCGSWLVSHAVNEYNRLGAKAFSGIGSGYARTRSHLSEVEEKAFLASFKEKALSGEITTLKKIKLAYEEKIGQEVHESVIYRLVARHGWRKIQPRPSHPKKDIVAQEAFKKTSLIWWPLR
jgi:transposase